MASKKPRLEKVVSPKGVARYPHLAEPDEYEGVLEYKTGIILDPADEGVAEFMAKVQDACQKAFDEGKKNLEDLIESGELKGKKLKDSKDVLPKMAVKLPWEDEYTDDGEETGRIVVKTKCLAAGKYKHGPKKGQDWSRDLPIFDTQRKPVPKDGLRLWGGSVIRVQCELVPYFATGLEIGGVSLRLYSVQIIELSSGGGDAADGFGVEEGYTATQTAPAADGFEDEDESTGSGSEEDDF